MVVVVPDEPAPPGRLISHKTATIRRPANSQPPAPNGGEPVSVAFRGGESSGRVPRVEPERCRAFVVGLDVIGCFRRAITPASPGTCFLVSYSVRPTFSIRAASIYVRNSWQVQNDPSVYSLTGPVQPIKESLRCSQMKESFSAIPAPADEGLPANDGLALRDRQLTGSPGRSLVAERQQSGILSIRTGRFHFIGRAGVFTR